MGASVFSTKAKILTRLRETLAMQQLSAECASKLRGDLMWMFSMCSGFLGKLAGPLLTAKQQHADPALNDGDLFTLRLLAQVVNAAQPREIIIGTKLPEPLVVYSDASFEQGVLRLGWVIYPRDQPPIGGTCVVPPEVIAGWTPRTQQIFPGESICALVVPYLWPDMFRNTDVLCFIDNEAAVSSLVKSTSKALYTALAKPHMLYWASFPPGAGLSG